ncbi:Helicase associated domain protein (plasmid) [Streptomyces sp. NBC_01343]|uniref:DEAD/DEAH box helicase n=1 Tax=Streptomyces sp. NBC_01343 TaxID=2903832 RepID=UPI002E0EC7FE|nr:Helicase associated domain protein [Streptomyces sp. NBC_01343]WSI28598.1 Helicase associated domain protein [Streptomyces sp. NBC_01343]WSI29133.1 Helicase associated domain protein [Streptomyces sp. NBC_01343]WSI29637.1 Helicase associated domain protein [Streptomyces sp. NBC_01343]
MQKTGDIVLWPHQEEAVEAIVRGLDIPPGKRIPEAGLRATVVAACGTGKTFIAAAAALRLARNGRVLVLLPTLDLLTQTVREWRLAGHTGPAVAVCSLEDNPALWSLDVRSTTSAPQLGLWHGRGPVTVYATYASLPVIAEAHRGEYGLPMDVFDLVVVDEAHRTSGSAGKAWADIHHQAVIPAMRRLYMTATPRIWKERPPRTPEQSRLYEAQQAVVDEEVEARTRRVWDRLPKELACSMDDTAVFGPVVYELSLASAISRGLLAKYQIVVAELTDPVVTPDRLIGAERYEEQLRGQRLAAVQTVLLETMATHGLQTTITFHHRTVEAEAFAAGLDRVAGRLHAVDPARHPARVWAGWLCGEHEGAHRQTVLADFGRRAGRAVLSNCRVLGEGVDIRATDSVALIDPKGSAVDIVQAIGRALRQKPGEGKMATLIVPVFLAEDEKPEDMLSSNSYRPLVRVLEGLRAHDERAVEMLAIPQADRKCVVGPSLPVGPAPAEGEEEDRLLLRFAVPRDPALIAKWISYQVINTEGQDWRRGAEAAFRYRQREKHLNVPYDHVEGAYPLGRWLSGQRGVYRAGQMSGERAAELEELGIVWDTADAAFAENLAAARAYYALHQTLAAPRHASALDKPVGQWLTNIRRPGGLGKDPVRARRRAGELAVIDPDWNPGELGWTVDWQRHHAYLRQALAAGARLTDIVPGVTRHGEDIGRWLATQRRGWTRLSDEQRGRLAELGVKAAVRARKTPKKPGAKAAAAQSGTAFQTGLQALTQYTEREGTTMVPRGHVETLPDGTTHRTGIWIGNQRARRAKLTAEQLRALAQLGIDWAQ